MKSSVGCVSLLLFTQGLAWEWPFLSARTPVAEPHPSIIYGACSNNGALVCNGPSLFGTCNYGSVVYQSVADGTICEDGKIVRNDEATSCPKNGALVCHGSRMYGLCNFGKVVYQPTADGTWCQDGQIVGTASQAAASYYSGVPHSVIPHSTITYSTIPHSAIPKSQPTALYKRDERQVIANPVANPPAVVKRSESMPTVDASSAYPGGGPTATIDAGIVHGTTTSLPAATATVNKYLGIPFAASPPVRFSPPEKPQSWSTPMNATAFKPACIQQFMCRLCIMLSSLNHLTFPRPIG